MNESNMNTEVINDIKTDLLSLYRIFYPFTGIRIHDDTRYHCCLRRFIITLFTVYTWISLIYNTKAAAYEDDKLAAIIMILAHHIRFIAISVLLYVIQNALQTFFVNGSCFNVLSCLDSDYFRAKKSCH